MKFEYFIPQLVFKISCISLTYLNLLLIASFIILLLSSLSSYSLLFFYSLLFSYSLLFFLVLSSCPCFSPLVHSFPTFSAFSTCFICVRSWVHVNMLYHPYKPIITLTHLYHLFYLHQQSLPFLLAFLNPRKNFTGSPSESRSLFLYLLGTNSINTVHALFSNTT